MRRHGWTLPTALFSAVLLLTLIVYDETAASFISVWSHSDTFSHGFLIVPICAFLVWRKRDALASLTPRPHPIALALLLPLGLSWLLGRATGTLVVEQFSLVGMLPALVCGFFGPKVTRSLAFPLGYLFFAVPFGDVLQPPLMKFTADFTVGALRMTGVPVSREGLYLSTPVAEWRVVEACSGLRFLVSGFALGCLFAYLAYRRTWKRLAFATLSIVIPIIANGLRAYVVVLVGYLSEMRLGRGFDHYAYGWLIFSFVMVAFFAAGAAFRDRIPPEMALPGVTERGRGAPSAGAVRWSAVAAMAVVTLLFWPGYFALTSRPHPRTRQSPIAPPPPRSGWAMESNPALAWRPAFTGAASETICAYAKGGATVHCYIGFYERQRQGRELIQYGNVIVDPEDRNWRVLGERDRAIRWQGESLVVRETGIRAPALRLLVWHWYWLPDEFTTSPVRAKFLQARASLLLHRDHAALIVLYASVIDDRDAAGALREFVGEMLPSIRFALHRAETLQ